MQSTLLSLSFSKSKQFGTRLSPTRLRRQSQIQKISQLRQARFAVTSAFVAPHRFDVVHYGAALSGILSTNLFSTRGHMNNGSIICILICNGISSFRGTFGPKRAAQCNRNAHCQRRKNGPSSTASQLLPPSWDPCQISKQAMLWARNIME